MAQHRAAEADGSEAFAAGQPEMLWTGTDRAMPLQALAAEKLAAHRRRRLSVEPSSAVAQEREPGLFEPADSAAARVRRAVAERYRQSVTYREYLEASAAQPAPPDSSPSLPGTEAAGPALPQTVAAPVPELRVRWKDDVLPAVDAAPAATVLSADTGAEEELAVLEEEIEFRLDPEFAEHHIEALPLQANIIEFPRQIVAPRKARPRLAEGPLHDAATETRLRPEDLVPQQAPPQMRIFEVEPEFISTEPAARTVEPMLPPAWQTSVSEESAVALHNATAKTLAPDMPRLKSVATLELRLMAACVDAFWVGVGFVAWASATAYFAAPALAHLTRAHLAVGAATAFAVLAVGYALVCFTFSDATPGMLYAEIGLCTFEDENPTRAAMRKRLLATLVSAAPLGLGLLWAAMDSERLAWNDRLSRMYLRSY